MAKLTITDLSFAYSSKASILSQLNLTLGAGEIGCILGASGCGKSTLLSLISGFLQPSQGQIWLDDQALATTTHQLPTEKRQIGLVFQDASLFPHLTVAQNIGFGIQQLSEDEKNSKITELATLFEIDHLLTQYPKALSGGQQQRTAIARALAPAPKLLLMDESFSSIDGLLKQKLCPKIRHVLKQLKTSTLMVSHDLSVAMMMADKTGVMAEGQLQQWGPLNELISTPSTAFVEQLFQGVKQQNGKLTIEYDSLS